MLPRLQDELILQNPIGSLIEVQSFDFIGVENFNKIVNHCLVDLINKLKTNVKDIQDYSIFRVQTWE